MCELHLSVLGEPLEGSPFRLALHPGRLVPSKCAAWGAGLTEAIAGETMTVTVQARDGKGHQCNHSRNLMKAQMKALE